MAEKTLVDGVGPVAVQLKEKLSSLERVQIAGARNLGGSISQKPGVITGDVSQTVSRITTTQRSAMEIGSNLAAKLERSGAIGRAAERVVSSAIQSTVYDKIPLAQRAKKQIPDLSLPENRVPDPYPKSVAEKIKHTKEGIVGIEDLPYAGLEYPPDLSSNSKAHVELDFYKYTRGAPFGKGQTNRVLTIALPIPENLTISHNIRYEERDTGALGELAQKGSAAVQRAADLAAGNEGAGMMEMLGAAADGLGSDLAKAAGSFAYTKLIETEPELGGLASQLTGTIPNPHPTIFFKGLDLRQFEWSWHFVPRSQAEAATLGSVLRLIKYFILPENASTFMDYPHLVHPRIVPEGGAWGKFKKAGVKAFNINFTGEGTSAFFVNGDPVSVRCSMTFQEIEAFFSGDNA